MRADLGPRLTTDTGDDELSLIKAMKSSTDQESYFRFLTRLTSAGSQLLLGLQERNGRTNSFASDADDLDPVAGAKFLTDRGLSQIGLSVHKTCGRISGLHGQKHHRRRVAAGAVPKIGRVRDRTDQDQSRQHR